MDRFKEVIRKAKELDYETLNAFKFAIMGFVLVDIFGIYYFLELKQIGVALLLVSMIAMGVVLILQRDRPDSELPPEPPKSKKNSVEIAENGLGGVDLGLPDPEEYEKRMEKAMGSGI